MCLCARFYYKGQVLLKRTCRKFNVDYSYIIVTLFILIAPNCHCAGRERADGRQTWQPNMKRKGSCCASSFLSVFFHFHLISPPHFSPWYSLRQMQQQRARPQQQQQRARTIQNYYCSQGLFRGKSLSAGTQRAHTKKSAPVSAENAISSTCNRRSLPPWLLVAQICRSKSRMVNMCSPESGKHHQRKGRLRERLCLRIRRQPRARIIMKQSAHSGISAFISRIEVNGFSSNETLCRPLDDYFCAQCPAELVLQWLICGVGSNAGA